MSERAAPQVAAIILAAGLGSRFSQGVPGVSKLLASISGKPLVRHVAEAALASYARPVVVVTGHEAKSVGAALRGLDLKIVANPDFAAGLSTSLRAGLAALPSSADAAIVLLGDMPRITPALIDRLLHTFETTADCDAVVPVYAGQRGNPVLLSRSLFPAMRKLAGDEGARKLLAASTRVKELAVDDPAVALDIDTSASLDEATRR